MLDGGYDFRIIIGSGEGLYEVPPEWKSHISEFEVEATIENGIASKLHFVIKGSMEYDIPPTAFPLEAIVTAYINTTGVDQLVFYGAILSDRKSVV